MPSVHCLAYCVRLRSADNGLLVYKNKYGVAHPAYPRIDLPFSILFDTIILVPIVLPVVLYQAVFE